MRIAVDATAVPRLPAGAAVYTIDSYYRSLKPPAQEK